MEKCFDVEAMTMNEIEEVIKEYKEEDVVVDELEVEDKRVVERYREVSDDESCCTNGSEIEMLDTEEDEKRDNETDVDMNEVYELVKGQEEELQQKIAEIKMKDTTIEMLTKELNAAKKNDDKTDDEEVTRVIEAIWYQNTILLSRMK